MTRSSQKCHALNSAQARQTWNIKAKPSNRSLQGAPSWVQQATYFTHFDCQNNFTSKNVAYMIKRFQFHQVLQPSAIVFAGPLTRCSYPVAHQMQMTYGERKCQLLGLGMGKVSCHFSSIGPIWIAVYLHHFWRPNHLPRKKRSSGLGVQSARVSFHYFHFNTFRRWWHQ